MGSLSTAAAALYTDRIKLRDTAEALAAETTGQAHNKRRHEERRLRITSTKAHPIHTRQRDLESLAERLTSARHFSSRATAYGDHTESVAKKSLEDQIDVRVFESRRSGDYWRPYNGCRSDVPLQP